MCASLGGGEMLPADWLMALEREMKVNQSWRMYVVLKNGEAESLKERCGIIDEGRCVLQ